VLCTSKKGLGRKYELCLTEMAVQMIAFLLSDHETNEYGQNNTIFILRQFWWPFIVDVQQRRKQ